MDMCCLSEGNLSYIWYMQNGNLIACVELDTEVGMYTAYVPSLPGAHTYARTLDELDQNLKEVIALCLEELRPNS